MCLPKFIFGCLHIYINVFIYKYKYVYSFMNIYSCGCMCMWTDLYICTIAYMYINAYVHIHVCVWDCIFVCVTAYMHIFMCMNKWLFASRFEYEWWVPNKEVEKPVKDIFFITDYFYSLFLIIYFFVEISVKIMIRISKWELITS